jgi:hypothetical protein
MAKELIPIEIIENKIFVIREQKVMVDTYLAELYGVETKNLNKAVQRNIDRFPEDFMFKLTDSEWEILRFQIGTSIEGKGGRRFNPYVFTEQGVAMLSSVLNSKRAIAVNVQIMRIFVKIRKLSQTNKDLSQRLDEIEKQFMIYAKDTSTDIDDIFRQLKQLSDITKTPVKKGIGFKL